MKRKIKYELTEEMVMHPDATYRCARVIGGWDTNGYDREVGYIRLPNEIFDIVSKFITSLDVNTKD